MFLTMSLLIIGLILLVYGADRLVYSAAARNHETDLAAGNIIGSNITPILLIAGSAALLRPIAFPSDILRRELPLFATALCGMLPADNILSRRDGMILLPAGIGDIAAVVYMSRPAWRSRDCSLTRQLMAELPRGGGIPGYAGGKHSIDSVLFTQTPQDQFNEGRSAAECFRRLSYGAVYLARIHRRAFRMNLCHIYH